MSEIIGTDVEDVARRRLRQDQGMAGRPRHDIEKNDRLVVLIDFVGRQFTAQDFGKDIVRVVTRHRALRPQFMLRNTLASYHDCPAAKSLRNGASAASSAPSAAT